MAILKLPILIVTGGITFLLPFLSYEIPFIQGSKQTWKYNYVPTCFVVFIFFIHETYIIYNVNNAIVYGQNVNKKKLFETKILI